MKKLTLYINEKLKINKNFKGSIDSLGTWEEVDCKNGYIWVASYDADCDSITDNLFKNALQKKPMNRMSAHNRFTVGNKPVLTAYADEDDQDTYVVFGYDKSMFGGNFAMYLINTTNNENTEHSMEVIVIYSNNWSGLPLDEMKNYDSFELSYDELDAVIDMYAKIEKRTEER